MSLNSDQIETIKIFFSKQPVLKAYLFGSYSKDLENENSDIDFLAEFENPVPATMADRYFGFITEASLRFGRPVQLVTPRMVRNPFLKRSMERDLTMVHGRDFT